jgi:NADH-quinone oxidoreductase subunit E
VVAELEGLLGIKMGQTTEDGMFTLEYTSCIGCCEMAPAMQIGETVYGNLTPEKIASIIGELRRAGK